MPTTQLNWRPSFSASCLHAAKAIVDGRALADQRLSVALQSAAVELQSRIDSAGLPSEVMWRHLIPLAATIESNRQLAELALTKAVGKSTRAEVQIASLAQAIAQLESAMRGVLPKFDEELALRVGPLRQQWEARGPGLLFGVGRLTEEGVLPSNVEVALLHPAIGGAGEAFLPYNLVTIEGVLTNPHPELPETVRLGWLVGQLNADLPRYGENVLAQRLAHVAGFAVLPPVLQAAEDVELVQNSPQLIGKAISAWNLSVLPDVDAAALISDWWSTYLDGRPPWGVALTALDQMFG
jgi:hypothetical protein